MKNLILAFFAALILSCQSKPVKTLSWETPENPERKDWSETVRKTVDEQFPKLDQAQNIGEFCPNYYSLGDSKKKSFWNELIVKMAFYESKWDPTTVFPEPPPLGIDSIGLMQLSYEDKYPFCDLNKEQNSLKDGSKNLQCAIRVMGKNISEDSLLTEGHTSANAKGLARYWSVMQPLVYSKKTKEWTERDAYKGILAHTSNLEVCRKE